MMGKNSQPRNTGIVWHPGYHCLPFPDFLSYPFINQPRWKQKLFDRPDVGSPGRKSNPFPWIYSHMGVLTTTPKGNIYCLQGAFNTPAYFLLNHQRWWNDLSKPFGKKFSNAGVLSRLRNNVTVDILTTFMETKPKCDYLLFISWRRSLIPLWRLSIILLGFFSFHLGIS